MVKDFNLVTRILFSTVLFFTTGIVVEFLFNL